MSSSGRNTINFTKTDRNCVMARDVLKRNYDGLICRDESMNLGGTSISLRFEVRDFFQIFVCLLRFFKVAWVQVMVPPSKLPSYTTP